MKYTLLTVAVAVLSTKKVTKSLPRKDMYFATCSWSHTTTSNNSGGQPPHLQATRVLINFWILGRMMVGASKSCYFPSYLGWSKITNSQYVLIIISYIIHVYKLICARVRNHQPACHRLCPPGFTTGFPQLSPEPASGFPREKSEDAERSVWMRPPGWSLGLKRGFFTKGDDLTGHFCNHPLDSAINPYKSHPIIIHCGWILIWGAGFPHFSHSFHSFCHRFPDELRCPKDDEVVAFCKALAPSVGATWTKRRWRR